MKKSTRQSEISPMAEEYRIVEKKLKKANEALKSITVDRIREVVEKAEKESMR